MIKYDSTNISGFEFKPYRKTAIAYAVKMEEDFIVETMEGPLMGKKGGYLVKDNKGNPYPCEEDVFETSYVLAE